MLSTAQLVLIKLIHSNSHSHLRHQVKKQLVLTLCVMKQQNLFLYLQNRSCLLQCLHCIIQPLLPLHQPGCFLQPFPLQIWEFKQHEKYFREYTKQEIFFYKFEPGSTFRICHVMIAIRRLKGWMTTWALDTFKSRDSKSAHALSKIQRYLQIHSVLVIKNVYFK